MREPAFWWRAPGLASALLAPLAAVYGRVAANRLGRPGTTLPVPVVCVGNLTVGGAGKTPTAIALARLMQAGGLRPVFLTRGYKGRLAGPLQVDAAAGAADVGDEPLLLARVAPTILARDRAAGAGLALTARASAIVMDDGLQNPSLTKTVALVVLDGRRGAGNARVFPAGPLRAPLGAQLDRAQGLLAVGELSAAAEEIVGLVRKRGLPVFFGRLAPDPAAVAALRGKRLLAYAGIADPEKFFATLAAHRLTVEQTLPFPDHHRFTEGDVARVLTAARDQSLTPVTTEKDLCRMQGDPRLDRLAAASLTLPIGLVLDEPAAMRVFLAERTGLRL